MRILKLFLVYFSTIRSIKLVNLNVQKLCWCKLYVNPSYTGLNIFYIDTISFITKNKANLHANMDFGCSSISTKKVVRTIFFSGLLNKFVCVRSILHWIPLSKRLGLWAKRDWIDQYTLLLLAVTSARFRTSCTTLTSFTFTTFVYRRITGICPHFWFLQELMIFK